MKKLAAVLALVMTSFAVVPSLIAPASAADDDPYTNGVRTSCQIDVPAVVEVDHAPRIRVTVRPNSPAAGNRAERPKGTVTVRINRKGTSIFTKTVPYEGRTVTVEGPVLKQTGPYVVRAKFRTADGTTFKSCSNETSFGVRAENTPGPGPGPNPGPHDPDGVIPDTGGPNLLWLILGLLLVGSGSGLVYIAKRRPSGPLYNV